MAEYLIQGETLDDIADAINAKTGGSSAMTPAQMVEAIASISGGGADYRIEYGNLVNGVATDWTIYGENIPKALLYYFNYYPQSAETAVTLHFTESNKTIGDSFLSNAGVKLDCTHAINIERIGEYSLQSRYSANSNASTLTIDFPKYDGYKPQGGYSLSIFRGSNNYAPKVYRLPSMIHIPTYAWYQMSTTNVDIVIGSIGKGVTDSGSQPFYGTTNATGTVTIYTTGALLDSLKTIIQNGAGSGLQFVYKASEATEYGGVSYAAGDTMLTVGGS